MTVFVVKDFANCQLRVNIFSPMVVQVPRSLLRQMSQRSTSTIQIFTCLLKKVFELLASGLCH
jgi:hypothetical protein